MFSYWVVAGTLLLVLRFVRNERGALVSCEVHACGYIHASNEAVDRKSGVGVLFNYRLLKENKEIIVPTQVNN